MAKIRRDVSLKEYSNYRIGGLAKFFLEVRSKEELLEGLLGWKTLSETFEEEKKKIFVLSGGTNILFDDKGFDGLVIHIDLRGLQQKGTDLIISSGVPVSEITAYCIENSLSGMEWAGGLPGTIGAAVRGNAGAFGGETKDILKSVESIDLQTHEVKTRSNSECQFDYRMSMFKKEEGQNEIILSVKLGLKNGVQTEIAEKTKAHIDYRKAKHPLEYPNIGSIFKNIPYAAVAEKWKQKFEPWIKTDPFPVVPAAKIFADLGLKGKRIGGAQISEKHPNYIVNIDNASSEDVKALIALIKKTMQEAYGITLEEEVMYV